MNGIFYPIRSGLSDGQVVLLAEPCWQLAQRLWNDRTRHQGPYLVGLVANALLLVLELLLLLQLVGVHGRDQLP